MRPFFFSLLWIAALFFKPFVLAAPFESELLSGQAQIHFAGDEEVLSLASDYTASIVVKAPKEITVKLPSLEAMRSRFQGFALAEGYSQGERELADGMKELVVRWRLVADPAAPRFRLAPFAVEFFDDNGLPIGSEATAPILFPLASLPSADGTIEISPRKFFVMPSWQTVGRWILYLLCAVIVIAALVFVLSRIRRSVRLHKMSPSERALAELAALLGRRLADRGLFKDYYVELTHVVRRYIERSYAIRAPRLTTEEFLESARKHPHFTEESLRYLTEFLKSADMVKFAGQSATAESAGEAASSARRYIERDSLARAAVDKQVEGGR